MGGRDLYDVRPAWQVRWWLWARGIRVMRIINQQKHEEALSRSQFEILRRLPTKHPGIFGIGLHVDVSEGIRQEGERFGFDVVVMAPDDADWTRRVLEAASRKK